MTNSKGRGQPPKVTTRPVLELFEEVNAPFITPQEVAEKCNCVDQTARNGLERLKDQGVIEEKANCYYLPDKESKSAPERIEVYESRDFVIAVDPEYSTLRELCLLTEASVADSGIYFFIISRDGLSPRSFKSPSGLVERAEAIFGADSDIIDRLLRYWWQRVGTVVYDSPDGPVVETQEAELAETIRNELYPKWVSAHQSETQTVVYDRVVYPVINAITRHSIVTDLREPDEEFDGLLQPIINREMEEVPVRAPIIGIDNHDCVHCFDERADKIYVVDTSNREIQHSQPLGRDREVSEWIQFIENASDREFRLRLIE